MSRGIVSWWVKGILFIAFLYSLVWGLLIVLFPGLIFIKSGLPEPDMRFAWQLSGVIEIALAIGYLMAFRNPVKAWQPVLMGLLFKAASMLLFGMEVAADGTLKPLVSYEVVNNLIWIPLFALVLYQIYKRNYLADEAIMESYGNERVTLEMFDAANGRNLQQLTDERPQMVVFLRHFGCTFCRESLADIAALRPKIEAKGTGIILVHKLEDEDEAHAEISKYGLEDLPVIADPEGMLYKKFKLKRGSFRQLMGWRVIMRGLYAGIMRGHGIGAEKGDIYQMPGIFLLYKGEVVKKFIHQYSSDRPQYLDLADCTLCH